MKNTDIDCDTVRDIVVRELGVSAEELEFDTPIRKFGDSLELACLMQEIELELGIEIPDEEAERLVTIEDIVRYARLQ